MVGCYMERMIQTPITVFSLLKEGARLPQYKTKGAAGADVFACLKEPVTIKPMQRVLVSTGLAVQIPAGFELQLRPRSGLALNHGITILNTPGTIDSDYRGELLVLLVNLGSQDFVVSNGDRIAQVVLARVFQADFVPTLELDTTERGAGGSGSTGLA